MLEDTPESHLDCKELKLVNPKGNQSWTFFGRTGAEVPICCPLKSWLIGKDPDAGKDWRRERSSRGWDGCMASLTQWTWIWQTLVKDREAWHATFHGVTKSWTWLSSRTTTMWLLFTIFILSVYITLSPNLNANFTILHTDWSFWSSITFLGF